jgi:predicted 3-demethylubiquinone-9 3-methyltransferase (glyoxalase superfamily)
MQTVSTCLWFDKQAEEAANFYCSVFKNSRILSMSRYGEKAQLPKGTALVVTFLLDGAEFMALNGGPAFKLSPAVSLKVACDTQAEVDHYWGKLIDGGGAHSQCGWLTDRFGLSWQVVPKILERLITSVDATKADRVMAAIMKMQKLDVAALEKAYAG